MENVNLENTTIDIAPVENLEAAPVPTETVAPKAVSFEDLYKAEKKKGKKLLFGGMAIGAVGTAVYYNRRYSRSLKEMRAEMREERKRKKAERKAMKSAAKNSTPVDEETES